MTPRTPPAQADPADMAHPADARSLASRLRRLREIEHVDVSDASLAILIACNLVTTVGLAGDIARHLQSPDSLNGDFLSGWHLVLYGGVTAVGVWLGLGAIQHGLGFLVTAGWTTIGFGMLAVGGATDAAWHAAFGTEANVEALVSPPHLVVFAGLALLLTSPIVIVWRRPIRRLGVPASITVLASMTAAVLVTSLFTGFLSPLASGMTLSQGYVEPMVGESPVDYDQVRGLGIAVWTAVVLVAALVLLLVRFRPVPTLSGVAVFLCGAPALALSEPSLTKPLVAGYAVAGVVVELVVWWLGRPALGRVGAAVMGALLPASMWATNFALLHSEGRLQWTEAMWGGTILLSAMVGAAVGSLVALPMPSDDDVAGASTGPQPV